MNPLLLEKDNEIRERPPVLSDDERRSFKADRRRFEAMQDLYISTESECQKAKKI